MKKVLIYGYGNPGRQDDGLGNEFINQLEKWLEKENLDYIETDSNYQLNIEDADAISDKDIVVFVDASEEDIEHYWLEEVNPNDATIEFTMHAVSCSFILDLCNKLYKKHPKTFVLHLKGCEWGFVEELSSEAIENMNKALEFIKPKLLDINKF